MGNLKSFINNIERYIIYFNTTAILFIIVIVTMIGIGLIGRKCCNSNDMVDI